LWGEAGSAAVRVRLNSHVRGGKLYRIRRGFYAKDNHYEKLELATRIFTPAYVSFETVLSREGLIFQYYSQVFVASYLTREIEIDGQAYSFRKIKDSVLTDSLGVENEHQTSVAGRERAFLDTLYLHSDYQFDHLDQLNWDRVFELLPIYRNERMVRQVFRLYKQFSKAANNMEA
jgi:predicted transcriptional regulator of viral defense system